MRIKTDYTHFSPISTRNQDYSTENPAYLRVGFKVQTGLRAGMPLGDCCAGLINLTGLDRFTKLFSQVTGKDCGCKARQNWLNNLITNFFGTSSPTT